MKIIRQGRIYKKEWNKRLKIYIIKNNKQFEEKEEKEILRKETKLT